MSGALHLPPAMVFVPFCETCGTVFLATIEKHVLQCLTCPPGAARVRLARYGLLPGMPTKGRRP